MNKIKFLKNNEVELNGILYKGYTICNLPKNFGLSEEFEKENGIKMKYPLIDEWIKLPSPNKGLIYIAK